MNDYVLIGIGTVLLVIFGPALIGLLWTAIKWLLSLMVILGGWGFGVPLRVTYKNNVIGTLRYFRYTKKN
jgi:hypothetical protein